MADGLARGGLPKPGGASGQRCGQAATPCGPVACTAAKQGLHDGEVRRNPRQAEDVLGAAKVEPAEFVVILQRPGRTVGELGEPDPHGRLLVERPARGGFGGQLGPEAYQHAQFFTELAVEGAFGGLARFHLATREFPHSGKLRRRRAPRHQQHPGFRQGVHYCAADDANESSHALKSKAAPPARRGPRGRRLGVTAGTGRSPKAAG